MPSPNGYAELAQEFVGQMRELVIDGWTTGTIKSLSPFTVEIGSHPIPASHLLYNPLLTGAYHKEDRAEVGNQVLLLQSGREAQVYVAVCRITGDVG